jgi:hypothetical protein
MESYLNAVQYLHRALQNDRISTYGDTNNTECKTHQQSPAKRSLRYIFFALSQYCNPTALILMSPYTKNRFADVQNLIIVSYSKLACSSSESIGASKNCQAQWRHFY